MRLGGVGGVGGGRYVSCRGFAAKTELQLPELYLGFRLEGLNPKSRGLQHILCHKMLPDAC